MSIKPKPSRPAVQPDVTLALWREDQEVKRVPVHSSRFGIGRNADCDLAIDDPGLSRRHALIEIFDGRVQVSDCGSRNGTSVNDNPIRSAVVLKDGDIIQVADAIDIRVHITAGSAKGENKGATSGKSLAITPGLQPSAATRPSKERGQPSRQDSVRRPGSLAIAALAAAGILLVLVPLSVLVEHGKSKPGREIASPPRSVQPDLNTDKDQALTADLEKEDGAEGTTSAPVSGTQIEKAAAQIVRQISDDPQAYTFPANALADIAGQVNRYRGSREVSEALRAMAPHCQDIARQSRPMVEPGLVIYAGLADTIIRGTAANPVEASGRSLPVLTGIWKLLGNQTGDDGLILVAAYRIGPVTSLDSTGRRSHPLLAMMRKINRGADAARTVWYFHDRKGIDQQTYDYVVGFIALGILSQHPKEFGLQVDPLAF
jgi:hypothetical protein